MTYESTKRIKSIVNAIKSKTGVDGLTLTSGIQTLLDGYAGGANAVTSSPSSGVVAFESAENLSALLTAINQATGYNDTNLTDAVQRLCDNYEGGKKLYSFGAVSDLHVQYDTGVEDMERAFAYLDERVPFTCVCGDLVAWASRANMIQYRDLKFNSDGSQRWNMGIYEVAGNHESYPAEGIAETVNHSLFEECTGDTMYYSFEYGEDLFIMLSIDTDSPLVVFPSGALQWLESTLEVNRNRRCFVFQHIHDWGDPTADPSHHYSNVLYENYYGSDEGNTFARLMEHYKNAIWFHGHTHLSLGSDRDGSLPIGQEKGYKSVHIPSLVAPRYYDKATNSVENYYYNENGIKIYGGAHAEGYIVDVYENKIVLRGIDFAVHYYNADWSSRYEVEPMADHVYTMDTTLLTIPADSFVDEPT